MPPRANWKGYLKLSLVSCKVALFPAASNQEKVSFHLLNSVTGNRLKQQYIDAETGEIVDREDRIKGYEIGKGDYVTVTDEELAAIEIESSHTIEIESFVPSSEVDPIYFDNRYYIAPDDQVGQEAFAVIREAMRQRKVAGIARIVLYGRERMILLEPRSTGIMGTTLHHNYEVRDEKAYFEEIPKLEIGKDLARSRLSHPRNEEGEIRPSKIQGSLSRCRCRSYSFEACRKAAPDRACATSEQCDQFDGRVASKPWNRQCGPD